MDGWCWSMCAVLTAVPLSWSLVQLPRAQEQKRIITRHGTHDLRIIVVSNRNTRFFSLEILKALLGMQKASRHLERGKWWVVQEDELLSPLFIQGLGCCNSATNSVDDQALSLPNEPTSSPSSRSLLPADKCGGWSFCHCLCFSITYFYYFTFILQTNLKVNNFRVCWWHIIIHFCLSHFCYDRKNGNLGNKYIHIHI